MAEPRNAMLDMADFTSKIAPLLFGQKETGSSFAEVNPAAFGQSQDLINLLTQRAVDPNIADGVIQDILYRAQLAFTPVLGEEKVAGMYNTTTKQQLAKDAVSRAAAASAQAVFTMQQQALQTASEIANTNVKSTTGQKTQSNKQGQGAAVAKSAITGLAINEAYKKGKSVLKGSGNKTADMGETDYGKGLKDYFDSGQQAADEAGIDISSFGPPASSGEFSISEAGSGGSFPEGAAINADQQLIDTITAPGDLATGANVTASDANVASTPLGAPIITPNDVITPLPMPPAIKIDPITGQPIPSMPPAVAEAEPPMPPASAPEGEAADVISGEAGTDLLAGSGGADVATENAIAEGGGNLAAGANFVGLALNDIQSADTGADWTRTLYGGAPPYAYDMNNALGVPEILSDPLDALNLKQPIEDTLGDVPIIGDILDSGCFITTAATKGGETDKGYTLTQLRKFRDEYMRTNEYRNVEVEEYYRIAPKIVERISALPNADDIWKRIRNSFLAPAVAAYENKHYEGTYRIYKQLVDYAKTLTGVS